MTIERLFFLRGEDISLTTLIVDDAKTMAEYMNDHNVTQYLSRGSMPMHFSKERDWIEALPDRDGHLVLGIWHNADQALLGSCGLHGIDHLQQQAELGIVIGNSQYWGEGIGSAVIKMITLHGFNRLNLRHIWLRVLSNNPRGKACYEKCGFVEIGRFPNFVYKDGEWHDEILMLKTNPLYT